MPGNRQNHCYAPGCKTGYINKEGGPKVALFSVPKDPARREKWERNLRRADKALDDNCAVCALHFEPRFVISDYVHVVQGQEVRIPHGKPRLAPDAVPTVLPNLPDYLSKKAPRERLPRKRKRSAVEVEQPSPNARRKGRLESTEGGNCENEVVVTGPPQEPETSTDEAARPEAVSSTSESLQPDNFWETLSIPSAFWTKHVRPGEDDATFYCASVLNSSMEVVSEKVVMFIPSSPVPYCKVYVRGNLQKEKAVHTQAEAQTILAEVDSLRLCRGAMHSKDYADNYWTASLRHHAVSRDNLYFSKTCLTTVSQTGTDIVWLKFFSYISLVACISVVSLLSVHSLHKFYCYFFRWTVCFMPVLQVSSSYRAVKSEPKSCEGCFFSCTEAKSTGSKEASALKSVTAGYGKHCSNAQEGCIAKRGRFGGKHSKTSTETAGSCETVLRGFESQSKRSSVHQEMGARVYPNENEKTEAL